VRVFLKDGEPVFDITEKPGVASPPRETVSRG
jgi:hypothetical protein